MYIMSRLLYFFLLLCNARSADFFFVLLGTITFIYDYDYVTFREVR